MARTDEVFLSPGEFHFAGGGTRIRTVLGSCVAITLWHPRLRVGGMCHYLLAHRAAPPADHPELSGRYADEAVQLFLAELRRNGTRPTDYQAKIFGGGDQFPGRKRGPAPHVPQDNIEIGLLLLREHGFQIAAEHLGGTGSRQLVFDLGTGDVWLQHTEHRGQRDQPHRRAARSWS
ncbi:chemotaxis protein CheD [Dactylosporangium sp. NPDC005555]|uniref:chemotaxis protein CheD n=1 Tax=Dactylosporangium sp. NPDC005555 TaxID=3154889 RepID=UPI0033A92B57